MKEGGKEEVGREEQGLFEKFLYRPPVSHIRSFAAAGKRAKVHAHTIWHPK